MSKKSTWIILLVGTILLAATLLSLAHSGTSSASQRVNAALDDLQAVGIRILDLPLFMLLATTAIAGAIAAAAIERFAKRPIHSARIALAAAIILALFTLAFTADRRINHMQNQISELRGKLNAQRMTMPDIVAVPYTSKPQPLVPSATSSSPLVAVTTSVPASTSAPASAPTPLTRDKLLIDPDAIKKALTTNFINPTLRPIIIDRASDAVELRIGNPQTVAYISVTDLKTPGLEIQYGGNLGFKTYTSDFARTNDCSIAINGEAGQSPQANSGLGPWYGNMITAGKSVLKEGPANPRPFLSFDKLSGATFTAQAAKERAISTDAFNVVWGRMDAVIDGTVQTAAERDRQPRTAMGISKDGARLILLVVDGRQQQYSVGFTRAEVGMVLSAFGANNGMLCDEGGSSCFYIKKFNGIVNSPSDGEERATYTHFGITLHNPAAP